MEKKIGAILIGAILCAALSPGLSRAQTEAGTPPPVPQSGPAPTQTTPSQGSQNPAIETCKQQAKSQFQPQVTQLQQQWQQLKQQRGGAGSGRGRSRGARKGGANGGQGQAMQLMQAWQQLKQQERQAFRDCLQQSAAPASNNGGGSPSTGAGTSGTTQP